MTFLLSRFPSLYLKQQGFGFTELLVALLIFSGGLIVALQASLAAVQSVQAAYWQQRASTILNDLGENIASCQHALSSSTCSVAMLTAWQQTEVPQLPKGQVEIAVTGALTRVTLQWHSPQKTDPSGVTRLIGYVAI